VENRYLLSQVDWKVRTSRHFVIYYQDPEHGRAIAAIAEYYLEKIIDDLRARRVHDWRKKYSIFVLEDAALWKQFLLALGIEAELTGGFTSGAEKGEIFLFNISIAYMQLALPHELTHIILDELETQGKKWPIWFDEGFANYEGAIIGMNEELLTEAMRTGNYIRLSQLVSATVYPNDVKMRELFYTQAEKLVEFLITQYGRHRFAEFARNLQKDDFEKALLSAYGGKIGSVEMLEKMWIRYLTE